MSSRPVPLSKLRRSLAAFGLATALLLSWGAFGCSAAPMAQTTSQAPRASVLGDIEPSQTERIFDDVVIDGAKIHAASVTVHVTGIVFADDRVGFDISATNQGDTTRVSLDGPSRDTFMVDDLGNSHQLISDPTNQFLQIEPGETASGFLVFRGRVHPDATALTLHINGEEERQGIQNSVSDSMPQFAMGPYELGRRDTSMGTDPGPTTLRSYTNLEVATLK